ncbi:MAG: DUF1801 domain-containing protein [Bacteroidia bacterium]|nr:DUF1801 domain-containing protein [Bacteroidia bacterium]
MNKAEDIIYSQPEKVQKLMEFFHQMLCEEFGLTSKVSFGNPAYYRKSWICYFKAIKDNAFELAFFRGNELSNEQGILESKGRKQLRSIIIKELDAQLIESLKVIFFEAIDLDEQKPYESKRKKK